MPLIIVKGRTSFEAKIESGRRTLRGWWLLLRSLPRSRRPLQLITLRNSISYKVLLKSSPPLDAAARWLAFAQGRLRFQRTSTIESVVLPTANPGLGEGRRPREFPSVKRV